MTRHIIIGIAYALAVAAQPGPFQTIDKTIQKGWKSSPSAAFSPLLSDVPIILLVLLLLSRIGEEFYRFRYLGSGIFLIYHSSRTWKAYRNFMLQEFVESRFGNQTLFHAALVNLLNPNPRINLGLVMGQFCHKHKFLN